MNPSLGLKIHLWRGIGADVEPDLFLWRYRFGLFTIEICKVSVLASYRKLRAAIVQRVEADEAQRARNADGQ